MARSAAVRASSDTASSDRTSGAGTARGRVPVAGLLTASLIGFGSYIAHMSICDQAVTRVPPNEKCAKASDTDVSVYFQAVSWHGVKGTSVHATERACQIFLACEAVP